MSTGLGATEALTSWYHPSPDEVRARIKQHNDGTQPLEPYQRISQAIFERYLKELADKNPLIDLRYGWKVNSVSEFAGRVETSVTEQASGRSHIFTSAYVGGCDGGSSKVRQSLELPLDGGPV
jgi:FAD-dependent monooxygenase